MPVSSEPTGPSASGPDVLLIEDLDQQRLPARTLAAVLRQAGYTARLVHFGPRRLAATGAFQAILDLVEADQPRLVIFSVLFGSLVPQHLALAEALRRAGASSHISMAGPLPSFAASELLSACPALDSVLCGEAETSVTALAALATGSNDPARWPEVPGLTFRALDGALRPAAGWPALVADLDALPFPVRDDGLPSYRGYGFATVRGSRGCYHTCSFCLPTAFYRAPMSEVAADHEGCEEASRQWVDSRRPTPYRLRSAGNLIDEIDALYRQGARLFLFDDEQFLPPKRLRAARIGEIERELGRRGLEIAFTIKCRPDDVEPGLFRQLQRMGLLRAYMGVESGCQASLDLIGKGITVERNVQALATLDRLGIVADFYDLLFHPWSTLESVEADIAFCRRIAPHLSTPLRFNEAGILPGTGLAARLHAEGRDGSEPWAQCYDLGDPRAEILRRLNRLVFAASASRIRTERMLTEGWYALLLERRFRPSPVDESRARRLREVVARLNQDCLEVWGDMLAYARAGAFSDAGRLNAAAARWAERVNTGCIRAAAAAEELGFSPGDAAETEAPPAC
jgi:anaerobic magnesium-protoporphyrin IX monomethyl ester cyclase